MPKDTHMLLSYIIVSNYDFEFLAELSLLKARINQNPEVCKISKLQSAVLLVELYQHIQDCFGDISMHFTALSDSEVATCWIHTQREIGNECVNGHSESYSLKKCVSCEG